MGVKIRKAMRSDRDKLVKLVLGFKREHSQMIGGSGKFKLEQAVIEVDRLFEKENGGYFLAVDPSQQLIGFLSWEFRDDFYFAKQLYVRPSNRQKGVATDLINHFESWLLTKNQDIACFSCVPHNEPMIKLARSQGYDILNTIEVRKNLGEDQPSPRGEVKALGFDWGLL